MTKEELRRRQGDKSLLEIALDVHGGTNGSIEIPPGDLKALVSLLEEALCLWTWGPESDEPFDLAVRRLIQEAVRDYYKRSPGGNNEKV